MLNSVARVEGATLVGALQVPPSVLAQGGGQFARNGAGVVVGVEPGTLLANNGANLVGNHSAGVVSAGGGAYRTLNAGGPGGRRLLQAPAPEQVPLAGFRVEVRDATGQPLRDAAGQPLTTTTDSNGVFAFQAPLPDANVVLAAGLPGQVGTIQAIATRDARGSRVAADMFSTLTTAYILERYVKPQPDPGRTLDRLPGEVERETRQAALAGFLARKAEVPSRLDGPTAVAATEALRQDPAFNAQMEAVRKVLLVAGLSDLGNGQPATQVALAATEELLEAPDGSIYFVDQRVWRVTPDGKLVTVVGGGGFPLAEADGRAGRDVALGDVSSLALDEAGKLLVQSEGRIMTLEADGKLRPRATLPAAAGTMVGVVGGDVVLAAAGGATGTWTVQRLRPDGTFIEVGVAKAAAGVPWKQWRPGLDPSLGLLLGWAGGEVRDLRWMNLQTGALTPLSVETRPSSLFETTRHGVVIYKSPGDARESPLRLLRPGTTTPLSFPGLVSLGLRGEVVLAPDGQSAVVGSDGMIHRVTPQGLTRLAGVDPDEDAPAPGTSVSLYSPSAHTLASDGATWVYAQGTQRLWRFPANEQGAQVPATDPTFWSNLNAELVIDALLRPGANGQVWVRATEVPEDGTGVNMSLYRVPPGGTPERIYTDTTRSLGAFTPHPDGSLYLLFHRAGVPSRLVRRTADGEEQTLFEAVAGVDGGSAPSFEGCDLAVEPNGTVWVYGQGRLGRWRAATGWEVVKSAPHLHVPRATVPTYALDMAALAVAPDGSIVFTPAGSNRKTRGQIRRLDPATGQERVIAGFGGTALTGTGADDGVINPGCPTFTPTGDLQFLDSSTRQVKRIPKELLGGNPVTP